MSAKIIFPEVIDASHILSPDDAEKARALLPESHTCNEYQVSLILPMYNVEPYLKQCFDSVFNQQDIRIQVIIVNDGSTDGSIDFAVNYCAENDRKSAIIIDQENHGLSAARNIGIRFALADYVAYLDTDDFMTPNAYVSMYNHAIKNDLDVVLCRSLVFNHETLEFSEFYDARHWDWVCGTQNSIVTNVWRDPAILQFEPNANPRLVRRDFIFDNKLFYPEGLQFEDMPVHIKALLSTEKMGLLNSAFYMYRVNRPGKITEQKSARRFDIINVCEQTIQIAKDLYVSPKQGKCILYSLMRITYWCGTQTLLSDRRRFFDELCKCYLDIPQSWVDRFNRAFRDDLPQLFVLWALRRGDSGLLFLISTGHKPLKFVYYLLNQRRFGVIYHRASLAVRRWFGFVKRIRLG